jgi:arylsulfatase A-like enzyme
VWPYPAEHFLDAYYCQQAIKYIEKPRYQPFALFLYLWAPHPPLVVPEPYASLFDPASIDLPPNVGVKSDGEPSGRRLGIAAQLAEGVGQEAWRSVWAAHLGLVNLADANIGHVVSTLDASGYTDETIVCFTVDHGDQLGQHRMYQKMEMYEPAIRIPLILKGPGIKSQMIDNPVSHLDVMPTVLAHMGLPIPSDLDGISMAHTLTSGQMPPAERPVFSQYSGNPTIGDQRRAVITQRYKAVFDPADRAELYDLLLDPLEMHNLADDPVYKPIAAELLTLCRQWGITHNDWVSL